MASSRVGPNIDLVSGVERSPGIYGTAPTCYLSALARASPASGSSISIGPWKLIVH